MKNKSGYPDPTASQAIGNMDKTIKARDSDVNAIIALIKLVIRVTGLELIGRIHLRDRKTGKEYR